MTAAEQIAPDTFRSALTHIPTGVMVVTTQSPTGHQARTANSFTSVSLQPPLVSICFSDKSPFTVALCSSGLWGVSVLAADQQDLSVHFAHRMSTKDLGGVPHTIGPATGAALLTNCVATLECRSVATQPAGDHTLVIGEVLALRTSRDSTPLVFYRGGYHTVT
ncbi:flavin reductase family protein [Actinocrispum wychmicini]|uniref:Flavin reductase (DIM6/NTAB) family NADH-FMN oxidoreductase RutF n=1 Tax=Actinocrispum wychmicini TaxID=1213861 RepID=A0A4R2JKL2_9PSEU|nr:flavin reductase family protein [Actinocrispum wychmicini]TCO60573.1 flavin reductase (DIM6/NTAB) family NADH-FMN oxidoreductase RutF [Actinocrispum wychmicini]